MPARTSNSIYRPQRERARGIGTPVRSSRSSWRRHIIYSIYEGIADILRFGDLHNDGRDYVTHLTILRASSFLPPCVHPGHIHLCILGIFVSLDRHVEVGFSGLLWHTSTKPIIPKNCIHDTSLSKRFTIVHFPNSNAMDGLSRFSLGARYTPRTEEKLQAKQQISSNDSDDDYRKQGKDGEGETRNAK